MTGDAKREVAPPSADDRPIGVQLTTRCDLRCRHCMVELDGCDLSLDTLRALAASSASIGCRVLSFTGGEPTLHPAIDQVLSITTGAGLGFNLVCNAWRFPSFLPTLRKHRDFLGRCDFSLDGATQEVHDALRRPGSFASVLEAAARCRVEGIRFGLRTLVTRRSLPQIEEIAALAEFLGADELALMPALPVPRPGTGDILPSPTEMIEVPARAARLRRQGTMPVVLTSGHFTWNVLTPCHALDGGVPFITARGDLELCCSLAGYRNGGDRPDALGNLRDVSLAEGQRRMRQIVAGFQRAKRRRLDRDEFGLLDYFPCWYCLKHLGKVDGIAGRRGDPWAEDLRRTSASRSGGDAGARRDASRPDRQAPARPPAVAGAAVAVEPPTRLHTLAREFRASRVFLTAIELGVFRALGGGSATGAELASELGAHPDVLECILDALVALALLEREGERYAVPRDHLPFLAAGRPGYQGGFGDAPRTWARWARLTEVARTGVRTTPRLPVAERSERIAGFDQLGRAPADNLARGIDCAGVSRMLDAGGGAGCYAVAFARRWPDLSVTLLDRSSEAVAMARRRVVEWGLGDRVQARQADLLTGDLGGPYDMVFLGSVLCLLGEPDVRGLLGRVHRCLRPAGRLVIRDAMPDDPGADPPETALFAVHLLVTTAEGRAWRRAQVEAWLGEAGFGDLRRIRSGAAQVIVGTA